MSLDDFDRSILGVLKRDARASNVEIAAAVGLSHSAVSRRLRRLEEEGVIRGYRVLVDAAAAGIGARAFVSVGRSPDVPAADLARELAKIDEVEGVWILSGDFDVMAEIAAQDMAHYARVMLERVQTIPGVAATRSMFVLATARER